MHFFVLGKMSVAWPVLYLICCSGIGKCMLLSTNILEPKSMLCSSSKFIFLLIPAAVRTLGPLSPFESFMQTIKLQPVRFQNGTEGAEAWKKFRWRSWWFWLFSVHRWIGECYDEMNENLNGEIIYGWPIWGDKVRKQIIKSPVSIMLTTTKEIGNI